MLAYIPSPAHGIVHIGPLQLHAYGLMLAIGVLVAAKIADVRWQRTGNDPKVIAEIAVPVVVGGVVGARVYHLFTGYKWSEGGIAGAFEIWKGGLSIWGAVAGGLIVGRDPRDVARHLDTLALLDAIAPGVVVAQAIGRWGNYFNQELFGRPSKLPWALEIDLAHRPVHYETVRDVPADVSLRVDVVPAHLRHDRVDRTAPRSAQGSGVRAVRRDVLLRALLLRVVARRPGVEDLRDPLQLVALGGAVRRSRDLVRAARAAIRAVGDRAGPGTPGTAPTADQGSSG